MGGFLQGILGGFIAWVATMLVAQPLYALGNLRTETARLLHFYDPTGNDDRRRSAAWIAERELAYRSCAAQLQALAASHPFVTGLVGLWPFHWLPREAGEQLAALAPLGPGAAERGSLRSAVAEALGLRL